MTSRERVGKAVNFQVPDRVPIDLGGMKASEIAAGAYHRLKKAAGHTRRDQGLGSALHDRRSRAGDAQEVPRGRGSRGPFLHRRGRSPCSDGGSGSASSA